MGCDIHSFVEYKYNNVSQYRTFAKVEIDRDYGLFYCLAGVRNYRAEIEPVSEPKGVPKDASSQTIDEYCYYISETKAEDYISPQEAEKQIKKGYAVSFNDHYISRSDWHSASWLGLSEVKEAYKRYLNYYQQYIEKPENIKTGKEFQKFIEDTKNITKPIKRNADIVRGSFLNLIY